MSESNFLTNSPSSDEWTSIFDDIRKLQLDAAESPKKRDEIIRKLMHELEGALLGNDHLKKDLEKHRWHKVSDELPDCPSDKFWNQGWFVCYSYNTRLDICFTHPAYWAEEHPSITHWMELPQRPLPEAPND